MKELSRIVIHEEVDAGQEVFTGIPGRYATAPEAPGLYSFVEYAKEDHHTGQLYHVRFAWEKGAE